MDKKVTVIAGVLLVVIIGLLLSGEPVDGEPNIIIIPESFDFGDIGLDLVEKDFIVKNTGTVPLTITQVSTSCGCTKGSVESETVPAGGQTKLHVSIDSKVMGNISGPIQRIVYVKSNDPQKPEVEVRLKASVVP